MRIVLAAFLFCATVSAQSLTFLIDDTNGQGATSSLPPLTSPYQFPDTATGAASSILIRVANLSNAAVTLGAVYVGASQNSAVANPNFTITGLDQGATIAPQAFQVFTLTFAPLSSGATSGYMQALENTTITSVSTLEGTGTPGLALTCSGPPAQCNGNPFNNSSPLSFGSVPSGTSSAITFTLANQTSSPLNAPSVSLQTQQYITSPFTLDTSQLPSAIAANASASFTLTFAPAQPASQVSATLVIGSDTFDVTGIPIGGLQISYVDQTGVRYTPSSNAIDFGQVNSSSTLTFTVTNPTAATAGVAVPISATGSGFLLSGVSASATTLQPGESLTFQLSFAASQPGSYSGTLTVGSQVFTLTATGPISIGGNGSALPGIYLVCGASACSGQTFTSQTQVNLSVQLTSAAPSQSIFTLSMSFAPSVSGVTDDSSVQFVSPVSGRNLQLTMQTGSQTATYQGNSQLTFQTGTTAGTITFTVTYLGETTTLGTLTIAPAQVQITSTLAQRQAPNLVVTLNGYDNTYSVGQLSFTFYDTSGSVIGTVPVNAASDFHQYFFGSNDAGGAFALQATFPVSGDVTQVGSVNVTLQNSAGSASASQTFQ